MSRPNLDQDDPTVIKDNTPFPVPELYFKVYDSEKDEPDAKIRQDVYKLYERWQEKYGRRWPENGMNTEDMVWLYEEAYKEKNGEAAASSSSTGPAGPGAAGTSSAGGKPSQTSRRRKTVAVEAEEYPGEFITDTEDLEGAARERLSKMTPAQAKQAAEQAKAEMDNANYVTDEFESEEIELGNLEQLYGTYLFDREGKPTYLPSEPAQEAMGEESEDWADFYGSVRPRDVSTEEVRDAVWATDEFESDEDNTESEWEPEYVGAGLGLKYEDPINPQWSLRHTNHPLAPFPGEALKWSSFLYDDGTSYEGLTREAIAHGMGVMTFGNGTGGGFHVREVARGDKYEGEFQAGYAHGLGMFTSPSKGEVYIGEFFAGQRHGCGVKIDMKPFYFLLERGVEPAEAYQETYDRIMRNIEFRTWYHGSALGDNNEDEHVLYAVKDDLGNPYDTLAKTALHDAKLKRWREMSPQDKAMDRVLTILDRVSGGRTAERATRGDALELLLNEDGDSSDGDSIDLMVGNTTEGGPGFGWDDDTDSELYPMDRKLAEQMAAEAVDAKADEQASKQDLLGGDLLNPFTGLSLADYLEGREVQHAQLVDQLVGRDNTSFVKELESEDDSKLDGVSSFTQNLISKHMQAMDKAFAEDNPYARRHRWQDKNWASEDSDTRFETESDMMELCDLAEILGTIDEAEEIVARARMWRWKPYGEVTLRTAQDAVGAPVELMQDPLHYPHGTKFMAPGPLGQCHPIPDDPSIKVEMARVAKNYQHVHDQYNFDWDPQPGSVQWKIDQRIKRAQELQLRRLQRMAMDAAADLQQGGGSGAQLQAELAEAPAESSSSRMGISSNSSSSSSSQLASRSSPWGTQAGTPFASMSMGIGRASRVVLKTLQAAAKHTSHRPKVVRPSQLAQKQRQ